MRRLIVALAATVLAASACSRKTPPPVAATATDADTAEQVLYGVQTVLSQQGVRRGTLVADTAFVFNDQTRFLFHHPRATFTKEDGAPNGTMVADRGLYDTRSQVLEGWGHVVITTVDGKRLASPHLRFDQIANIVSSDTTFSLTDGNRRQDGTGFESDPQLNRFSCKRGCRGSGVISIPAQ